MTLKPHYVQTGAAPAIIGGGFGVFACPCGKSLLIAGYEPRLFLGISIACATCGDIAETPGLPVGAPPPANVLVLERGAENPPAQVSASTVLIGQQEVERLAALFQPRRTEQDVHRVDNALLDDVEFQQWRLTGVPLDPAPAGYKQQSLAWAVAHFRGRLRQPDWTNFADNTDMVAMTVIAAVRDLFGSWAHHPLFGTMVGTAAAGGFSLHALALFAAAKALALSGNQVGFVISEGSKPQILSLQLATGSQDPMSAVAARFDRFEWPDGAAATERAVLSMVIEAMDAVRGHINRLRPGMLVLSPGASEGTFDQMLAESVKTAIGTHGKRHRGLAAMGLIIPKVDLTGHPREVRFGHVFFPVPNRHHELGRSVRIGTRTDYTGRG